MSIKSIISKAASAFVACKAADKPHDLRMIFNVRPRNKIIPPNSHHSMKKIITALWILTIVSELFAATIENNFDANDYQLHINMLVETRDKKDVEFRLNEARDALRNQDSIHPLIRAKAVAQFKQQIAILERAFVKLANPDKPAIEPKDDPLAILLAPPNVKPTKRKSSLSMPDINRLQNQIIDAINPLDRTKNLVMQWVVGTTVARNVGISGILDSEILGDGSLDVWAQRCDQFLAQESSRNKSIQINIANYNALSNKLLQPIPDPSQRFALISQRDWAIRAAANDIALEKQNASAVIWCTQLKEMTSKGGAKQENSSSMLP